MFTHIGDAKEGNVKEGKRYEGTGHCDKTAVPCSDLYKIQK